MLLWFARLVCHRPCVPPAIWIVGCVVVTLLAPAPERLARTEPTTLIPPDEPYGIAVAVERGAFPRLGSRTRTVLVFQRTARLTDADRAYLAEVTTRLASGGPPGSGWGIQSPASQPYLRSRLTSSDGRAAMIVINSDANYVTRRSQLEVEAMEKIARVGLPAGLAMEITGEGGVGRDLNVATARALERTTWVTVSVVLLILLFVYRAPLAALVPLLSISLTAVLALGVLDLLALIGWSIGAGEKTFAIVLIFGSGTDFAMFWIARYRETLSQCPERREAAVITTAAVSPAIMASAGTTIAGLSMLATADLLPSRNAGQVLAVALAMSLAAALTLIPCVARLMGRSLFWPQSAVPSPDADARRTWRFVARTVTRYPVVMVAASLALLAWPVVSGAQLAYRYDGLGVAPPGSSSARGEAIARRRFSAAQLFSWTCLIETPTPQNDPEQRVNTARCIADAMAATPGVADVWSLADPLGRAAQTDITSALARTVARSASRPYYLSDDSRYMRFEVMQAAPPMSADAAGVCTAALKSASSTAKERLGPHIRLHSTGLTPYRMNIKDIATRDQRRVTGYVVGVILVILTAWTRKPALAVVMLGATLLVYYATLGATRFVFAWVLGVDGLDWKVRLFLFVILVAVGQDYNIFLVSRLLQERREHSVPAAAWRAIVHTGTVISSCGVIMAATLGSLTAAGLPLYRQLGFAFAFGILLDTFLIRPIVVPGLYLILYRRKTNSFDVGGLLP